MFQCDVGVCVCEHVVSVKCCKAGKWMNIFYEYCSTKSTPQLPVIPVKPDTSDTMTMKTKYTQGNLVLDVSAFRRLAKYGTGDFRSLFGF